MEIKTNFKKTAESFNLTLTPDEARTLWLVANWSSTVATEVADRERRADLQGVVDSVLYKLFKALGTALDEAGEAGPVEP